MGASCALYRLGLDWACVVVESVGRQRNLIANSDLTRSVRLFGESPMCRIRFLILIMAFTAPAWSNCQAAGSFQTKPAFPKAVTAGIAPSLPTPTVSPGDLRGGCGRGRVRDPQTHACRGPADIR